MLAGRKSFKSLLSSGLFSILTSGRPSFAETIFAILGIFSVASFELFATTRAGTEKVQLVKGLQ